jgi:hypothetical protein
VIHAQLLAQFSSPMGSTLKAERTLEFDFLLESFLSSIWNPIQALFSSMQLLPLMPQILRPKKGVLHDQIYIAFSAVVGMKGS